MASTFALPPIRSISLPSRLHPTSHKIEAGLNKFKKWEESTASTIETLGAKTIQIGIVGLAEIYDCVEELLSSSHTQQALLHNRKVVEEALDCSLTLLDTCGGARDLLFNMKEHVQGLQSALRRRGGESSICRDIGAYISFRKKTKKEISKCMIALKRAEVKIESFLLLNQDHHLSMVVRVLREVSTITFVVHRSLLLFLLGPSAMKTRIGGWSLIPMGSVVFGKENKIVNEMGSIDAALYTLHGHVRGNDVNDEMKAAQRKLETLAVSIDGLEAGLDCMFRRLIQYRVTLLNVISH